MAGSTFRRRSRAATILAVALGVGALIGAGPRSALGAAPGAGGAPYPVPWDFLTSAAAAAAQYGPGVAPPGSDLACTPSARHPDPVVLVHGLAGDQNDNWQTMSPYLADLGYCVFSLTYGNDASYPAPFDRFGGLGDMTASAGVLAEFVQDVLADTGASKVDIVGHSEGGTVPDYYIKFLGGYRYVDHFVAISGVLHGTTIADPAGLQEEAAAYGFSPEVAATFAPLCTSCLEFSPSSAFTTALDEPATGGDGATVCADDGADVLGVTYTSLATDDDELVHPATSDFLDPRCANTTNLLVQDQCATDMADHLSMAADPVVAQDVANALDPEHAASVRCSVVLPAVG